MKTSFNYMQKFFILLMMGFSLCAIQACSGDDDLIDNPVQNTKDIAVTGSVDEYGCTFAKISGYANLNLLPAGSGNPQIGIEISMAEEEDDEPECEIATSMRGNSFSVEFRSLNPEMKYKYRSFVEYAGIKHYGEYKSFTTKGFPNLITTGDVLDISISTATVAFNVVTDAIDENPNLGIAYSTSEAALRPDGVFHVEEFSKKDVAAGVCCVTLKDLSSSTTYYYASFVEFNGKYSFEEIKSFTTKEYIPESVDLGLSVKWACCNVGASSPEGYGGYYAWGETEEKSDYDRGTYKYYNNNTGYINIGSNISGTQYDVAHVKWGGSWRMPTLDEIEELVNNCSWKWTTQNGVNGQLVTGPNGNSIFLPAAGYRDGTDRDYRGSYGYYWSATLDERYGGAYGLLFYSGYSYWRSIWDRKDGLSVRPVTE